MKHTDDSDEVLAAPRPRESGRTIAGLGVDEIRHRDRGARNGDTPQSPISLDDYTRDVGEGPPTPRDDTSKMFAAADAAAIMSQLSGAIEDRRREDARIASELGSQLGAKIDTCIDDVRALAKTVQEHVASQAKRDEALFALLPIPARVDAIEKTLGRAPGKLEERASQIGEKTAAELADLESGTGALGVLGRLVAGQARLLTRVGLVAVAGWTIPTIVSVLIQSEHGAAVAYAALGLVLFLIVAVARRRWRAWRSKS